MTKIFEIRKAGLLNQGAAMMLIAVIEELRHIYPKSIISVAPDMSLPFQARAKLGLWHRAELIRFGGDLGKILSIIPEKLRRRYGFVTEKEVNIVIDAAGLAYSDQWGANPTQDLADRARRWSKQGKKLILLPQALGPFTSPQIQAAIREVADYADLIFARDDVSYQFITDAVGKRDNILKEPDFTNLLKGYVPDSFDLTGQLVALVPNCRMLDKTSDSEKNKYVPLIQHCARKLLDNGMAPFLLIHEGVDDYHLAEEINEELDTKLPIIHYKDSLATKGILGCCQGIISSRYHALVSGLSQGIPCLGTGWSHKYQALFNDYGCPKSLISTSMAKDKLEEKFEYIYNDEKRIELAKTIKSHSEEIKDKTRNMWKQVIAEID